MFHIKEHVLPCAHMRHYARATSLSQDEQLVQHVKQYTPRDNPNPQRGDVTILGAHANGFPKELYEPLWEDLVRRGRAQGFRVRTIFMADAAWQGRSGALNSSKLGNDPSWFDYSNDMQHLVNLLRPTPPIVAVGHSFGGAAVVTLALQAPRLFTTLVLLDPVMSEFASTPVQARAGPAAMSAYRRDVWPDRETAVASFEKSPFHRTWERRVLDRWLDYGIRDKDGVAGGEVELSTTKHQEVFTYLRPSWPAFNSDGTEVLRPDLAPDMETSLNTIRPAGDKHSKPVYPFYRGEPPITLSRLPNLRPSAFYIFGLKSDFSGGNLREQKLALTGSGVGGSGGEKVGRVAGVTENNSGHLVALEAPDFCAKESAAWIKKELDRWWQSEREYDEWTKKSQQEKSTISEEWMSYVPPPQKRPSGKNKQKAKI